ncbi:bifunctional 5,10-methylenetetrahydrofolate dehydrogenase/5,10-methenyltetrahydrofolate cyclohydrolase [Candidatus Woesearchaeota archaeon]|nr:bifunctional 5,10-methylenetetrahydrofolate dehydrogenase/5,10-methenyltetrahydrofolate cyclohydrolase [Candidatus Woesearchaeota archaeon]
MATILDGKKAAEAIRSQLRDEISRLGKKPGLAAIIVGSNPASKMYVDIKERTCRETGILSERYSLPEATTESGLTELIKSLNSKKTIHAILVQLPLPKHISEHRILSAIEASKDVDGFTSHSKSQLLAGNESSVPCTPKGIIRLLELYKIPIEGKNAVIIGRSEIVGKPTALMLLNRNATVTICHSKTANLREHTLKADIIVAAAGKPGLVTAEMVRQGSAVIDVGTTKVNGRLIGDVDYEKAREKAGWITPVPGGVGPMTVAMLLENTLQCYKNIEGEK